MFFSFYTQKIPNLFSYVVIAILMCIPFGCEINWDTDTKHIPNIDIKPIVADNKNILNICMMS